MKPKALILQAQGTNRDGDVAQALSLAGAKPVGIPLNELRSGSQRFSDFQMLVLAGGFSYADALGAGKLLALDLNTYFEEQLNAFISAGKPVIGICNGFQALVKSGVLPGKKEENNPITLTFNQQGHFECRWVNMVPVSQTCVWTKGLTDLIYCPIAHGEGNLQAANPTRINQLMSQDQIALMYAQPNGSPARGEYPLNPNGSFQDVAGLCNAEGNVLGLMPHPENHIYAYQHPQRTRGISGQNGLALFQNGVHYAAGL